MDSVKGRPKPIGDSCRPVTACMPRLSCCPQVHMLIVVVLHAIVHHLAFLMLHLLAHAATGGFASS